MQKTSAYTKLITLASLGGALEFFDFTIYALFAHYISNNFFPQQQNLVALVNTYAIFAVGYLARPLGGIIFGHFGDKHGRKTVFSLSVFLMAFSTLLIGCLPTYQQIGMAAPALLLLLRILQGISVGGEIPGATVFSVEHVPVTRRGLAVGLIFMGVTLGNVLGGGLGYGLTTHLNNQAMLSWGWRIPFIVGFFLGLIAYFLRKKTLETPIYLDLVRNEQLQRVPGFKLLQIAFPQVLIGISLTALSATIIFLFLYIPSYPPAQLHYSVTDMYLLNILGFSLLAIFTAFFGFCSDYIGRKNLIILGALLTAIVGYYLFTHLFKQNSSGLFLFGISLAMLAAIVNGCYGCLIAELFPAKVRYSGMAISYNIGFGLFGGMAPFIITEILNVTRNPLAPYYFLLISCAITLFGALAIKACIKSPACALSR